MEVAGGEAGGAGGGAGPTLLAGFGEDAVSPEPAGGALVAGFDEEVFFCDLTFFLQAVAFLFSIIWRSWIRFSLRLCLQSEFKTWLCG